MRDRILVTVLLGALGAGLCSAATGKVTLGARSFTLTTPRLEATVCDGVVVSITDLGSGEVHADAALADCPMPTGLGHLTGNPRGMAALHSPWGNQQMNQDLPPGQSSPTMHRPGPASQYQAVPIQDGVRATWTGLTNGAQEFPEESLTLEAWVDAASGQMHMRAAGSSPAGGCYGLQVPLANLHPDHAFYVPSFGGVRYDQSARPGLITLGGTPFWEAPVVAVEGRKSSLGLWIEDDAFRPSFFFMNWSGKSFSLAIESLQYMPYEELTAAQSATWRLDSFAGGWVDAMTPYRRWYAAAFAPELAARAAVTWADRIRVIVDHCTYTDEALRQMASLFDPETVLFHEWNARAPEFDHDLPDWTPRAGYPQRVARLQQYGFRTMAYVNTYCVNYNSAVFQRDRIAEFGLTRRSGGLWDYTKPSQSFATAKDGQLLYLDPLSPRWRAYHTDMMIQWRKDSGTDANYEDVGGTAGDFGNGTVAGKAGAQGGTEQFRELLRRNPGVPMASEYAPDHMAFAVRWPLRYQQVWGNDATRTWWMEHQRPVSAYIHGPLARPWIPVINAEGDVKRHVVVACADALGGLAQLSGTEEELRATSGMPYHMRSRAQLFASRQLTPVFPSERWAPGVACHYQDRDGRRYVYSADVTRQEMAGPDGQPLYQRVTGLNQLDTALTLPGWPAAAPGRIMGLNPEIRYALQRGGHDRTRVQVTDLPAGIRISRYESTPQRTVLVLAGVNDQSPREGRVTLRANRKFVQVILNDKAAECLPWDDKAKAPAGDLAYTTPFPAHFVLVEGAAAAPKVGEYFGDGKEKARYIAVATGLERGGELEVVHHARFTPPGEAAACPMFLLNGGGECEVVLDYLVAVPTATSSLQVFVRNAQTKYGNGAIPRLYVNGRVVREKDLGPVGPNPNWKAGDDPYTKRLWDTDYRRWTVPLGHLAGQGVAVTLATDAKNENNADMIWWSRPRFVDDPAQQASFVRLTAAGQPVAE